MLCEECFEFTDNYQSINGNNYCDACMRKYMLVPCPGLSCNNIISLNGFDELDDVENYTCTSCDTIFCDNCLVRAKNLKLCNECFDL